MPNLPLKLQGIAPDLDSWEQGTAWGDCQNMRFRRNTAERVRGYDDTQVSTGDTPGFLQNDYSLAENWWVISSLDKIQTWNGTDPPFDATPAGYATLTDVGQWTGTRGPYLDRLIVNTIERPEPYVWNRNFPEGPLFPYPTVAAGEVAPNSTCLRSLFNVFLFCLDTADDASGNWDSSPTTIVWSDATTGTLPTFIPAAGNRAGSTTLATSTPLLDIIQLRESAILFSSTDIFRVDFTGGQEVFDFTRIFSGDGLLTRNCCAEYEGTVFFLSTSGALMATDGTDVKTLGDNRVNLQILDNLNDDPRGSWVAASPVSREILFAPTLFGVAAPSVGYIYDVDSGHIGQRTWPDQLSGGATFGQSGVNSATADDSWDGGGTGADTWNDGALIPWNYRYSSPGAQILFISTTAEKLYRVDLNSTGLQGALSREGITPDPESDRVFVCRRAWIDGNLPVSPTTLQVTVGGRYDDSSPHETQTVAISAGAQSVPLSVKGRQFSLALLSSGLTEWDVSRVSLEFADATAQF